MSFARPLCENPVIIFNRKAIQNLCSFDCFYFHGKCKKLTPYIRDSWRLNFPFKKFYKMSYSFEYYKQFDGEKKRFINWDALDNTFCGYDENKQKVYLFLAVPCNHCVLCTDRKHNDFIARVKMENQSSLTLPLMVTLTYAPPYLPFRKKFECHYLESRFDGSKVSSINNIVQSVLCSREPIYSSDCVVKTAPCYLITRNVPYFFDERTNQYFVSDKSYDGFEPSLLKSDVQKFLKRLRINWQRSRPGDIKAPLRYVCFGEYGHYTHRPHYHLILWNVPYNIVDASKAETLLLVEQVKQDILKAWGMCVPEALQCEIARDAGAYVGKYISKNMTDSQGNKGFSLASNRGGGIGALFLKPQIEFYRNHPSLQEISYTDKWTGEFVSSKFGRFVHDKIFPSSAKVIPDKYKQFLRIDGYLLSSLASSSRVNGEHQFSDECETVAYQDNKLLSFIPTSFSSFVDNKLYNTKFPVFTMYLDLVDELSSVREEFIDSIDGIALPSESDLFMLSNLRYQHDTLFDRPDITDDYIFTKRIEILEKRAVALDSEVF